MSSDILLPVLCIEAIISFFDLEYLMNPDSNICQVWPKLCKLETLRRSKYAIKRIKKFYNAWRFCCSNNDDFSTNFSLITDRDWQIKNWYPRMSYSVDSDNEDWEIQEYNAIVNNKRLQYVGWVNANLDRDMFLDVPKLIYWFHTDTFNIFMGAYCPTSPHHIEIIGILRKHFGTVNPPNKKYEYYDVYTLCNMLYAWFIYGGEPDDVYEYLDYY